MIHRIHLVFPATLVLALIACGSVNQNIEIGPGEQVEGNQSTVNGRVIVGDNARVDGNLSTVNGAVEIGADSQVGTVETVNGSITVASGVTSGSLRTQNGRVTIAANSTIDGEVHSTNGAIRIESGSRVRDAVRTVNGLITLDGASAGALTNTSGGMLLDNGCRVTGELRVGAIDRERDRIPEIVIGQDCEVDGPLVFERDVKLRVHQSATIGEVRGAEVETFDGPVE